MRRIRGRRLAYVQQGAGNALNPVLTVGEQVAEPMLVHLGLKKPAAFEKVAGLMEQMGISGAKKWLYAYPYQYSGGMKQRALVAMGVAAEAGLLLADEPTKGVDWENRDEILRLFQELEEKAVLTVTHDLCFAEKFSRRIAVMYAAQIVETAQTEAFFARPLHLHARALIAPYPVRVYARWPVLLPLMPALENWVAVFMIAARKLLTAAMRAATRGKG